MAHSRSRSFPRSAATRVIGTTCLLFVLLVAALLLARPEMMMTAIHRAMTLIFVP